MFSTGQILGLLFAIGVLLSARPALVFLRRRQIIANTVRKVVSDPNFANQIVMTCLYGACSSLVVGVILKSALLTLISLFVGSFVGFKSSQQRIKNQAVELDLSLRLASGSFLDLVGVCMRSGMSIRRSIIESATKNTNEIQEVWKQVVDDSTAEYPFLNLLADISNVNRLNVMGRIARTLLIAQERGTPISLTLQGLSSEIRSETRRQLLEIAAKKDVTMMVPVVFGILPSITAIALYPAFISLSIM